MSHLHHMRGQSHMISYVVSHNEAITSSWHSVPPCFLVINRWKIIAVVSRGAQLGQQLLTQLSFWVLLISHCLLHMLLEEIDFCSMKLSCRSFLCCKSCRTTYIKTRLITVDMHLSKYFQWKVTKCYKHKKCISWSKVSDVCHLLVAIICSTSQCANQGIVNAPYMIGSWTNLAKNYCNVGTSVYKRSPSCPQPTLFQQIQCFLESA